MTLDPEEIQELQAEAGAGAAAMLEAMGSPKVRELHQEACEAMARYAEALAEAGIGVGQTATQLHGAVVSVILRGLGLE